LEFYHCGEKGKERIQTKDFNKLEEPLERGDFIDLSVGKKISG
jgi:hypothetical protein